MRPLNERENADMDTISEVKWAFSDTELKCVNEKGHQKVHCAVDGFQIFGCVCVCISLKIVQNFTSICMP